MKIKNMQISRQINLSLAAIFLIIIILAVSALASMEGLWSNTNSLYDHSLIVRWAVGSIETDVLTIHRNMMQMVMEKNQQEADALILEIDALEADAYRQVDVFYASYIGPKNDIDETSDAMTQWKTIRTETLLLLRAGQNDEAYNRVEAGGVGGKQADLVMSNLDRISDFASSKTVEFYHAAQDQRNWSIVNLSGLLLGLLIALLGIGHFLSAGILLPINQLITATEAMQQGKMDTRSPYDSTNEFGKLSKAFNGMASTIETEMLHKDNVVRLSSIMFSQDALRPFCQELLKALLLFTDSQIGAIYFLNEEKTKFEQYESIGIRLDQFASFSLAGKEGEFGAVIATRTMQHLTDIPSDQQVIFSTVSGDFKAKEIITIPIVYGSDMLAMISFASIKCYSSASVRLINSVINEISARIGALMASQRVSEFSQKLQNTNTELQQQSKELKMQTDELSEQNTELEMQKKQLNEANRLKTDFLSNMSHELRTPLNSVIALSGVLGRRLAKKIPEEEYSYLEIIERNGKNLLALINDILDISRIEAGREEIEATQFNVNTAIAEVLSTIKPLATRKNVEVIHESSDTNLVISSDADKLRHILQNLIDNAVKFTDRGKVTILAQQLETSIEIKVTDTGIGISEEHLPFIFDEFRQADSSTARRFGGTGLGLAISKKYANLLGGTISVKSTPGEGSVFTVSLPLSYLAENRIIEEEATTDAKYESKQQLPQAMDQLSNKSILLVEDNESAIIQIKDLVEEMGYQISVAHDGGEALGIIVQTIPDAMILDLMMPGIDGFRVLETLRNAEPTANIPVLILTAKQITKEELKFLKRNNIHQLIQKGDVDRIGLQKAVSSMLFPEVVEAEQPQRRPQAIEGKPVVLVVEDNPDNMITLKALLTEHYSVLEAVDALQGIVLAKEHLPNLILMDIALPGMDGIQAFREIRSMPKLQHIPIIALTASAMLHERETILAHGFDAFIAKPIIEKEFVKVINEVLYGK
ncbi:MAG TPA: response regulator [Bacillota bacterium]|nr:response regulator [Bacillota bacterium]